jgi:excisionase family DNA binding protein
MRQETFPSHLRHYHRRMHTYRIGDAAALLGVSADTVRRLVDGGKLTAERDDMGHRISVGAGGGPGRAVPGGGDGQPRVG